MATTLALAAASCSSSDGDGQSDEAGGTVTIWSWKGPTQGLQEAAKGYQLAHPEVKIEVTDVGNPAIWTKITTGMAAGGAGLPDVMNIGVDYIGSYIEKFPTGLEDLSAKGAAKLEPDFAPGAWASGTGADGKVYGIPYEVNPAATFYRTDLFQKAGVDIDAIGSWDQLIEAGKTIKAKTGASLFALDKSATTSAANYFQTLMALQDTFYFDEAGKITLDGEKQVKALGLLKKANDLGLVANVSGNDGAQIQTGKVPVATMDGPAWMAGSLPESAPEMKGKWGIRKEIPVETGGSSSAIVGGTYLSMSATSKHKSAAWDFMQYALGTKEGEQALYKGGGLFPGYLPLLEDPSFSAPDAYYGGQNPKQLFASELKAKSAKLNYTSDYAQALKAYDDAQTAVLLRNADPATELQKAAKLVATQTGRELANG
ncbi:sugar ABC transporter substrate-binding protein [Actinoplanes sp. NPDC049596]|uniref:ABC transporter substrate-binding protein n=1 Tax=unclassified Actinoplanes TaxID=2626549 RepID=UPI003415CFAC